MKLVNCTGKAIHVLVGETPVLLEEGTRPAISGAFDHAGTTAEFEQDGKGYSLKVHPGEPSMTLFLPEPVEGTVYLVANDILLRAPHRDDLATPAYYRGALERDEDGRRLRILSGINRELSPINPETSNISTADIRAAEAADAG